MCVCVCVCVWYVCACVHACVWSALSELNRSAKALWSKPGNCEWNIHFTCWTKEICCCSSKEKSCTSMLFVFFLWTLFFSQFYVIFLFNLIFRFSFFCRQARTSFNGRPFITPSKNSFFIDGCVGPAWGWYAHHSRPARHTRPVNKGQGHFQCFLFEISTDFSRSPCFWEIYSAQTRRMYELMFLCLISRPSSSPQTVVCHS